MLMTCELQRHISLTVLYAHSLSPRDADQF